MSSISLDTAIHSDACSHAYFFYCRGFSSTHLCPRTIFRYVQPKYDETLINQSLYIVIVAVFVAIVYSNVASFYRSSAREIKRLDSMLRSVMFAHFAESLTGLPTIRSYGVLNRFIEQNRFLVDLQNRALFLTVTNQRSVLSSV